MGTAKPAVFIIVLALFVAPIPSVLAQSSMPGACEKDKQPIQCLQDQLDQLKRMQTQQQAQSEQIKSEIDEHEQIGTGHPALQLNLENPKPSNELS